MLQAAAKKRRAWTAADLLAEFGPVPLYRVVQDPAPGTADEAAAVEISARTDRSCELIDGVLLEKAMGTYESLIAATIASLLGQFVREHKLGVVLGADGMLRLAPGQIRIPDVSFISWNRLPNRKLPRTEVWSLAPNLAIEIVSRGNTSQEMRRKLRDYFKSGVELVWYVYPRKRQVVVFTAPTRRTQLVTGDTLDGGKILPGFRIALEEIFAEESD